MISIFLQRHCIYANPAEILPGRLPVELSTEGLQQAVALNTFYSKAGISHIYSSQVHRCQQTAEIISGDTLPVTFDRRLLETLSAYQGYQGANAHSSGYHFYSHRPELGGESLADIQHRMIEFWESRVPQLTSNIIICSHGDPIQTLYSHLKNLPLAAEDNLSQTNEGWIEMGQFMEIRVDNGAVQEILPARYAEGATPIFQMSEKTEQAGLDALNEYRAGKTTEVSDSDAFFSQL